MRNKSQLDRVHLFGRANAFDRDDFSALWHAFYLGNASQCQLAIHDDRAGAAVPIIAGDLRAGQITTVVEEHLREKILGQRLQID